MLRYCFALILGGVQPGQQTSASVFADHLRLIEQLRPVLAGDRRVTVVCDVEHHSEFVVSSVALLRLHT